MKKRNFLKGAAAGAGAVLIPAIKADASENRLYGTPGSIDPSIRRLNALRLSISKSDLPVETWDNTEQFIYAAGKIFEDQKAAEQFVDSPSIYFTRAGIKLDFSNIKKEVSFLKIGLDKQIQKSVSDGNYEMLFKAMKKAKLHEGDPTALAKKIAESIRANYEKYLEVTGSKASKKMSSSNQVNDFVTALLGQNTNTSLNQTRATSPMTNVNTATEVAAITYVVVTVFVAVAAFIVAIAAIISVEQSVSPNLKRGGGGIGKLDNKLLEDYAASAQMAKFMGVPNLELKALHNLVHQELEAILIAMAETGLCERSLLENEASRKSIYDHVDKMFFA